MSNAAPWLSTAIATLMLFGFAASDAGAAEASESVAELESLQHWIDALQSMQASFEQVMFDAGQQPVQTSSGRFSLLRPGRFRWDYSQPFEQTIVSDGQDLWIYDADLEQVTVRRLDDGLGSTPAMLLSGAGKVADAYLLASRFTTDNIDWVELQPRAKDSDFGRLRLGFDDNTLVVMDLLDGLGQTTRIYFTEVQENPQLGDQQFEFEVPDGADVIRADNL